jgi:hypothetical protein
MARSNRDRSRGSLVRKRSRQVTRSRGVVLHRLHHMLQTGVVIDRAIAKGVVGRLCAVCVLPVGRTNAAALLCPYRGLGFTLQKSGVSNVVQGGEPNSALKQTPSSVERRFGAKPDRPQGIKHFAAAPDGHARRSTRLSAPPWSLPLPWADLSARDSGECYCCPRRTRRRRPTVQ